MNNVIFIITFGPGQRKDLETQIKHIRSFNITPDIIIVDQSDETWSKLHYPEIIKFYHLPAKKYSIYEMFVRVLKEYNHEYVCWNNDDDFINFNSIENLNNFISNHKGYSYISGQVRQITNKKLEFFNYYGFSDWINGGYEHLTAFERIKKASNRMLFVNPHAFINREVFVNACEIVINCKSTNLSPIKFWDKILYLVCLASGKVKTNLRVLSHVRMHRSLTGEVVDNEAYYHPLLEKNTPYVEIFNRISLADNIIDFIANKTKLSNKQSLSLIKDFLKPNNFRQRYIDKFHIYFPSRTISSQKEILKIKKLKND